MGNTWWWNSDYEIRVDPCELEVPDMPSRKSGTDGIWSNVEGISNKNNCVCLGHLSLLCTDVVYSVIQSCPTPCDPMDCSMPSLPVPHHLPKFAQVHVYCIGDAIQPSHLLMLSSLSALNLSQHQGLFQWINCSHQVTQYWSFITSPCNEYSVFP